MSFVVKTVRGRTISGKFLTRWVVGTLFIDIDDTFCLGTGLPILVSKDVYQYHHFN